MSRWWLALLLTGCDIGSGLVAIREEPPTAEPGEAECEAPIGCADLWEPSSTSVIRQDAFPVPGCEDLRDLDDWSELECARWELAPHSDDMQGDAGIENASDEGDHDVDALSAQLSVDGVQWRRANLHIETDTPLEIVLEQATLSDVYIELQGPVHLRFVESQRFDQVHVAGTAGSDGLPSISLERVEADGLTVSGTSGDFAGRLEIIRSTLNEASIQSQRLTMESVSVHGAQVGTDELAAVDVRLNRADMILGFGQISASRVGPAVVTSCTSLIVAGSAISDAQFAPCEPGVLRLYESTFDRGTLDGNLELDRTYLSLVQIGTRSATEILAWESHPLRTSLCAEVGLSRWGERSTPTCLDCRDHRGPLCLIPNEDGESGVIPQNGELCEPLAEPDDHLCEEPLPQRTRPGLRGVGTD